MIEAAMKAYAALVNRAADVRVSRSADGRHDRVFVNGVLVVTEPVPPAARQHLCHTVSSLVESVRRWGQSETPIWVSADDVIAVLDDGDRRREHVMLHLTRHPLLVEVAKLALAPARFAPGDFWQWLRRRFRNHMRADVINQYRSVKMGSRDDAAVEAGPGRESIGRSVLRQVITDAGDLPETVLVTIPFHAERPDAQFPIELDVGVDLAERQIVCQPVGGQIEQVTQAAIERLAEDVVYQVNEAAFGTDKAPAVVLLGTPAVTGVRAGGA